MSQEKFNPSESSIQLVMSRANHRGLAIAYLRAKRRADDLELVFSAIDGIESGSDKMASGDYEGAIADFKKVLRSFKTRQQKIEGQ